MLYESECVKAQVGFFFTNNCNKCDNKSKYCKLIIKEFPTN